MNRNYQSEADVLLKRYDEKKKLEKVSKKAAGLTSFLTGKPESDLVISEVKKRLPLLWLNLNNHLNFYSSKSQYNGNIANLNREIDKCDKELSLSENNPTLQQLNNMLTWIDEINEKYGFEE